jgi:D-3-phosphoglycerate dehydrogenase
MAKVLVADGLSESGIAMMQKAGIAVDNKPGLSEDDLAKIIGEYEGLVVRSATTVTPRLIEAGKKLQVIGRAGVGVDNVDIPTSTRRGIIVMNTPLGNIESAAEHAIALIFAAARHVAAADKTMKEGKWEKKKFTGIELAGKVLGIVGLGKVGQIVCKALRSLDMQVLAFDPFLPAAKAADIGVKLVDMNELLQKSDFITIHTPLTESTKNLINADAFKKMKKSAILVNCARGGVVDEDALVAALKEKKIKMAALDVFGKEPLPAESPLRTLENIVLTPHLGASTVEAQERVAEQIAEQFVDFFANGKVRNAVNMAATLSSPDLEPFAEVAEMVGELAAQLVPSAIKGVEVGVFGSIAKNRQDAGIIARYALKGVVSRQVEDPVNLVNVDVMAETHGLVFNVTTSESARNYKNRIMVKLSTDKGTREIAGTLFEDALPRIVAVDDFSLELTPARHALIMFYEDKPGMVGKFGTILGKNSINIAAMSVGRREKRGQAVVVLSLDEPVPDSVTAQIEKAVETKEVYSVTLPSVAE